MKDLIESLGVNWQSLLFQVINFFILLYILKRFAYGPLVKLLEERKKRVEESERNAEEIAKNRERSQQEYERVLLDAKKDAQGVREKAMQDAESVRVAKVEETKKEIATLLAKAKQDIRLEKEQSLDAVRAEAAGLVIAVTEKVLQQKLTSAQDAKLIEQTLKSVSFTSK